MTQTLLPAFGRTVLLFALTFLFRPIVSAQPFTGTNPPGAAQDFPLTVNAGTTNLAIAVSGTAATFSHLLLKRGTAPSDADFDFIAMADGQTNAINLELPELQITNYVLRVRTPANSLTHNFTATVLANQTDLRSTNRPATKPIVGSAQGALTAGTWHYYRADIATNVSGWRLQLSGAGGLYPDLYVQRGRRPTDLDYLRRSISQTNDVVAFAGNELTPGAYFIGVSQPPAGGSTTNYVLQTDLIQFVNLTWDPGTTHPGTQVYSNAIPAGGDFYFKISTLNSPAGAWRTALNVAAGEASVFLTKGTPPTAASFQYKSDRVGSDGFIIPSTAFSAGEDWYYLVQAGTNAQWTLVSGEPFVTDLGTVAADGSSGSGNVSVGAEGIRYFKTTVPANALAWRLWLNGATNTVLVKRTSAPHPSLTDLTQVGQMLVVPSFLVGGQQYFVGIAGNPGAAFNLDSRQHAFTDIQFLSSTSLSITGYPYATFRVTVPANQLAWQTSVTVSNGNPNIAVRRNFIPNEFNNDAYSEVGGVVSDSVTLVPAPPGSPAGTAGLSDGTYFVTVYGTNNYTCTMQSGDPVVTDINFVSTTINDDTNRVGWRFYRVVDTAQQLGALGWDLFLTNHAPGTRIALRRNAVPGIWTYRTPAQTSAGYHDFLSTLDFLQRPGHQADVWYIGVYNPNQALGAFTLVTRELTAAPLNFDGGSQTFAAIPPGKWQYFRVDIPANALGWDIRILDVSSGLPQLAVRRDALPALPLNNIGFSAPVLNTNWPSGNQWVAANDWTDRNFSADGAANEGGRILSMGIGRPLEPGTYYVGVINATADTNAMNYAVFSRGIGDGMNIPVTDLAYNGGSSTANNQLPREATYYRVLIPTNTHTWKVRLAATTGDALLLASKDRLPNVSAGLAGSVTNAQTAGKKMTKLGNEHFVLLPLNGQSNLMAGTYFLAAVSEGVVTTNFANRIGAGNSTYTVQSIGLMPEIELGTLASNDIVRIDQLEGGESIAYHFMTATNVLGFEIELQDRVGNPVAVSRGERTLADPGVGAGGSPTDPYGNEGGENTALIASANIITVADPFTNETIMVKARINAGAYPDASYTLRVRAFVPEPLAFDGGVSVVSAQVDGWKFFRVDVPPGALGWDVRITNVVSGSPQMVVSRDALPIFLTTLGFAPGTATTWPSFARWAAGPDWTLRANSSDGLVGESGRILAMGMNRPLEPGTYYVAVRNNNFPTPASYTMVSRGIGAGLSVPVADLPFSGGSVTNTALPAREAAYYRVVIPAGARSWQVKLSTSAGEAMVLALTNALPSVLSGRSGAAGRAMQKLGNEHYVFLPTPGQSGLAAGTNYLAVVSEGTVGTNANNIGTGNSSYVIQSLGEMPIINLGTVGPVDLVHTNTLEGGESRAYQFDVPPDTLSLEARLENFTGNPVMVMRVGINLPNPGLGSVTPGPGSVNLDDYGNEGGYNVTASEGNANNSLLTVANPTNGTYTLMLKSRGLNNVFTNSNYTLRVRAIPAVLLNADGGTVTITNQVSGTWRYFLVDIPTNTLGWDIRLATVTSGQPKLVVRRDQLPSSLSTIPWSTPGSNTNWPGTNQWAPGTDWTRRNTASDGVTLEDGRVFSAGMGRPLEPGTYYVGVVNSTGTNAMSYTIQSRLIGSGWSIPVTDLAFIGGTATNTSLAPREAAYYRVTIPTNTTSWKVRVSSTGGELMLVTLKDTIPNIDSGYLSAPNSGKYMQKAGSEHYVLLGPVNQTNVPPGTYYLAVVGEGVNPASPSRVGSGTSSFVITSEGSMPNVNLGTIGLAEASHARTLEGGESAAYQFTVPPGALGVEVRLDNRVGNPVAVVRADDRFPQPGWPLSGQSDLYGYENGQVATDINPAIVTVANPTNAVYTVVVKARVFNNAYPDAGYTLRVRQLPAPDLNFGSALNGNGFTNRVAGLLQDNQRAFYKVVIPSTNSDGTPVIGWELGLAQSSGLAMLRVRKDSLPSDLMTTGMVFTSASAIIAPPFLTNGTWYVEVRGSNTTDFLLTSESLALQRPAWNMQGDGQPTTTPGLTAPAFGDTGLNTSGNPLPGDQGIDLQQGYSHYYAVVVPTNNIGLMRVVLEAISGNPDFFMRYGFVPTVSHHTNGQAGQIVERAMTGPATDYANWVPLSGRTNLILQAGTWYIGVRAAGTANARYRLRLSTGNVQDLALNGGSFTSQIVAGGDWRYYRVNIPLEAPTNWMVTFSQQSGDVVLYLRDGTPPGNGASNVVSEYKDWVSDNKNNGPYANYDPAGTYTFTVPPVRPGNVYYLGFRANNDATFSVSSSTSGGTLAPIPTIDFYGGTASNSIPSGGTLTYRIFAPPDAARWKHTSTHSASVSVSLENGTLFTNAANADWRSSGANSSFSRLLDGWPWVANASYFLVASNSAGSNLTFTIAMDGRNLTTDDEDADGLPDAWERQYFGGTTSQNGATDFDLDGVSNLNEFLEGTNPASNTSLRPRLTVLATNGVVNVNPAASNYAYSANVTLTATPNVGYLFIGWGGSATGAANPLNLVLTSNRTVIANFRVPADDFVMRVPISGISVIANGSNVGATKETGEPNHWSGGGKSVWWSWQAPYSGSVVITTAGSDYGTLVGVYTGSSVTNLTRIADDFNSGGPNTSRVAFTASSGTIYQIAVDGIGGASGNIVLNLSMPNLFALGDPARPDASTFRFTIIGTPNRTNRIDVSTDLLTWSPLTNVVNPSGSLLFNDPQATNFNRRFYRAMEQ